MTDSIPAWYELSWRNKLVILIHCLAFEAVRQIQEWDERLVGLTRDEFSLPEYVFPAEGDFGFGPVLKFIGLEREHWLAWECILPAVGEESEQWNRSISALRATLALLFQKLQFLEVNIGWGKSQLIVVEDLRIDGKFPFGGSLSAVLTPAMMIWLSRHTNCRLVPVMDAMKSMDSQLVHASDCGGFLAEVRAPKWLNLTIPGNSCGLDPKDYYDERLDRGYQLHPHNVDNGIQQLTFLAGLACLHDLARAN